MVKLVTLRRGEWFKAGNGDWDFKQDPEDISYSVLVQENESFDSLMDMVKTRYMLAPHNLVSLTFRFPEWMLVPDGK